MSKQRVNHLLNRERACIIDARFLDSVRSGIFSADKSDLFDKVELRSCDSRQGVYSVPRFGAEWQVWTSIHGGNCEGDA